jgi:tripartite-type tricarboxylate transporter receptor subunit TctC
VPADRVAALRKAFEETMKDPEFQAEAKKTGASPSPLSWQEVEKLIQSAYATPAATIERAGKIIAGN